MPCACCLPTHQLTSDEDRQNCRLVMSYVEIYNERLHDLLQPYKPNARLDPQVSFRLTQHPAPKLVLYTKCALTHAALTLEAVNNCNRHQLQHVGCTGCLVLASCDCMAHLSRVTKVQTLPQLLFPQSALCEVSNPACPSTGLLCDAQAVQHMIKPCWHLHRLHVALHVAGCEEEEGWAGNQGAAWSNLCACSTVHQG